ncbi:glycosyltransferase family 2 protein [Arthrobacter sp. MMS18-M83]|uniref:glycosyltransferase family 2 protein n=1 Tax=Arthrobacter sp. MMS18-M83 TaxID=2996261 RepID=UPI00227BA460|nr:glycosyltransferase family 2 protein [Arthrobacter sp. MMS18-M83]WAH95888.1 glycosyltransferase [Arthrobacter sp. MMS18-M83]
MAHVGGVTSAGALLVYILWRIVYTMPSTGPDLFAAWALVVFEALPLGAAVVNVVTLWNIDSRAPEPLPKALPSMVVAVLIPTYNEPAEVLTPTIAAACALEPAHQTWVLDDGDRDWVRELCMAYGARYVRREVHDHAKAGNLNHALELMTDEEAEGSPSIDIIAVLDCDHVPLPAFLTATLGWFADENIALVQGLQAFYNAGAFDDDGITGEQGLFFNVQLRSRNTPDAGPFWCGSTSLLRRRALREIGGIATETITEDMHTTLKLIRRGWKTVYHHQTLALGLAPATPEQYLLQRRRWGLGCMQILTLERLWAAKRWMSWRNYHEYLNGTVWWLEGVGTVIAFLVPMILLFSGATTTTADPVTFSTVFTLTFLTRLWGAKHLMRKQVHWPTAFALRIFRIPVGLACLWWLMTRRSLKFEVTPKGGAGSRAKGSAPRILTVLTAVNAAAISYAAAGAMGFTPSHAGTASTLAAGGWLLLAAVFLILGMRRIRADAFATSRRNAHRFPASATIEINGAHGTLLDISVGGASVRTAHGHLDGTKTAILHLPGSPPVKLEIVRLQSTGADHQAASLRVPEGDWHAYRILSLWLFHTPLGVLPGLPAGAPAAAATKANPLQSNTRSNRQPEIEQPFGASSRHQSRRIHRETPRRDRIRGAPQLARRRGTRLVPAVKSSTTSRNPRRRTLKTAPRSWFR